MATVTSYSIVLKLIHPDVVRNSLLENVRRTEHNSMERYNYLITEYSRDDEEGIQTRIDPNTNMNSFFVNLSIGEPPVWQIVAIDSASSLLWVPCHPCITCNPQSAPLYNPSKSSTYTSISCDSDYCREFGKCEENKRCTYYIRYGDSSTSSGELGIEELKFWSTLDNNTTSFSNILFGCGRNNQGLEVDKGILGLSAHRLSLVSRLGSKFSYCIGDIENPKDEHNHLIIGEYAYLDGASTPLETDSRGFYYVTLEGISVGDKKLDIDPKIFKKKTSQDGVIIDSGTTLTYLARSAYDPLVEEVQKLLDGLEQRVFYKYRPRSLCYKGKKTEQLIGFPTVTYHFAGEDADFFVENEGMYRQFTEDIFCLAVEPVFDTQFSVIGLYAQQYYNIGYDLKSMTLYFENIDCGVLL